MVLDSSEDEDGDAVAISEPRILSSLNSSGVGDENLPVDIDMAEKEDSEKEPGVEETIPSPLVSDEGLLYFANFETVTVLITSPLCIFLIFWFV
jgi:hypothetical protein